MKCSYCGFENSSDAKFCVKCGKEIVIRTILDKDTRYEKQYSLPDCLYSEEIQIELCNGGVYVGNVTKRVIAQFKMKNLSDDMIKAIRITINQKDSFQNDLGNIQHNYIDLNAANNQYFGEGIPVELNSQARLITMKISSIVYESGKVLNDIQMEWVQLPKQTLLIDEISKDAFNQYQSEFGKVKYHPIKWNNLVLCACGNIYTDSKERCPDCRNSFDSLMSRLNQNDLELEFNYKLACKQIGMCQEFTDYLQCAKLFDALGDYKDSVSKREACQKQSEAVRKQSIENKEKAKTRNIIIGLVISLLLIVIGGYFMYLGNKGTSDQATTSKVIYTPGTYTGRAHGIGAIAVKATFDENSITDITIYAPNETESIGGAALGDLKQQILDEQSADIDGVSGATLTSNAVKEAMEECIEEAKNSTVI